MNWFKAQTSGISTTALIRVLADTFHDLPDETIVSIGTWIETPNELLPRQFAGRLALKVGDFRQIKRETEHYYDKQELPNQSGL